MSAESATPLSPGDPQQVADSLHDRFVDLHGRGPVGVFAAPGRVNLIGEHVDYNGGRCLPFALPHATYAALAPRDDERVSVTSLQQDRPWTGDLTTVGPGHDQGWAAYVVGVAWALREQGWELPGMDVVVDSRVPVGAGLSSSAALECAVALGLCELAGVADGPEVRRTLQAACIRAEGEVAGAPTGGMDQMVALFAEERHALLLDFLDGSRRALPWQPEQQGLELLVVDTRAHHALTDGGYASRRADCERAAGELGVATLGEVTDPDDALSRLTDERVRRRARHVFTELARVDAATRALDAGDPTATGPLLTASHASLRDDHEVSCVELDVTVDTALEHGAIGARMVGGGFGGSAIALVAQADSDSVAEAVLEAFAARGWAAPAFLRAPASAGAHRVS